MNLRDSAPLGVKNAGRRAARIVGRGTSRVRMTPDFLLAGTHRGGTTSMHRALIAHPAVLPPAFIKGINYFDINYAKGPEWYRGHFPVRGVAEVRAKRGGGRPQTLESSGYYMYHPLAGERIAQDLPDTKLVITLRNPVERAWSAHRHEWNRGFDPVKDFEEALDLEAERTTGEAARLAAEPHYVSFAHRHFAYTHRGQYAQQLRLLFDTVGRDRVHVLFTEDFGTRPEEEFGQILEFLGLPSWAPPEFGRFNPSNASPMPADIRERLEAHFAPHDAELAEVLERPVPWRS